MHLDINVFWLVNITLATWISFTGLLYSLYQRKDGEFLYTLVWLVLVLCFGGIATVLVIGK